MTAAWSNGWGSCGSSSDGYSTGSRLRTRRTPGRPVSSVIVFCRVISAPPPDLNLVLHVPAPPRHSPGTGNWRLQSCRVAASCPAPGPAWRRGILRDSPSAALRLGTRCHETARSGESVPCLPPSREKLRQLVLALQVHGEAAGLLHRPCPGRVRGHPGQVPSSGAAPGEHQHVQPLEQHRSRHPEVTGDDRASLGGQELPPGRPGPPRRRTGTRGVQDLPKRGRGDRIPGPRQLTLDSPMPPAGFSRAIATISVLTGVPAGGRLGRRRLVQARLRAARSRCQRRIVARVTGKISGHRRRFTSRDNAVSQSRPA